MVRIRQLDFHSKVLLLCCTYILPYSYSTYLPKEYGTYVHYVETSLSCLMGTTYE